MERLAPKFDPTVVESMVRSFWTGRDLPPAPGTLGPSDRPVTRQMLGALQEGRGQLDGLARAVVADVEARYLALAGRRVIGVVAERTPQGAPEAAPDPWLARLACWSSLGATQDLEGPDGSARRQRMAQNLARMGLLTSRAAPLRSCPTCRTPRTPETIIYQSERGPALIVRVRVRDASVPTSLLVWTDSPWKLMGTTAILVSPQVSYVIAKFRRRGTEERILVARSAIPRIEAWLPGSEIEIVEERPGSALSGLPYEHPLWTEVPGISDHGGPPSVVLASSDVGDSGTGIVALVPRHGAADSQVAVALQVEGPTIFDSSGYIPRGERNKYSSLPVEVADSFVQRDLAESGLIFAELTVQRGVPYCAICGSRLLWLPGRTWSLDQSKLTGPVEREFARLLPDDLMPPARDVVPWPLSESSESSDPNDPELFECGGCERVHPPAFVGPCPCGHTGGRRVRRRFLPAAEEVLIEWSRTTPAESVQIFVPDRRRVPMVVHHLLARLAAGIPPTESRIIRLPTIGVAPDRMLELAGGSADAIRAALVRSSDPRRRPSLLADRLVQEARRLRKVWQVARWIVDGLADAATAPDPQYAVDHFAELSEEDRAFLSRFERLRADVRRLFDEARPAEAQDRLVHFFEFDLRERYLPLVRGRTDPNATPSVRVPAQQLLARILLQWAELYAPIAPHTMEAIVLALLDDPTSLFERGLSPPNEAVIDVAREREFDRWASFAKALAAARRQVGLPSDAILPHVVLLVGDDALADEISRAAPVLGRIGRAGKIEVDSPNQAWAGRRVEARAVLPEIQRVYGTRATRIAHLLERLPGRKALESLRAGTLSVTLDGEIVRLLPGMVEFTESLPECVVPIPWPEGEILLVDPQSRAGESLPSLSLDGLAVIRHIGRRLRRRGELPMPSRGVVVATGPLAAELDHHASGVASHLSGLRLEVVEEAREFPLTEVSTGRTRRGEHWAVWIPGLGVGEARTKSPRPRPRACRVPPRPPAAPPPDPYGEAAIARYQAIDELSNRLSTEIGRPIFGPAKLSAAWEAGFRSYSDFEAASYEALLPVPGFGPYVAGEVARHFGRPVPVRPRPVIRLTPPPEPAPSGSLPDRSTPSEGTPPGPGELPEPAPERVPSATAADATPDPLASPAVEPHPFDRLVPARPPAPLTLTRLAIPSFPAPPSVIVPAAPLGGEAARTDGIGTAPAGERPRPTGPRPFAATEATSTEEPAAPERPAGIETWIGTPPDAAWQSFLDLTRDGLPGICITREPPGPRRLAASHRAVDVVWLSNIPLGPGNPTARPGDLDALESGLRSSIAEHGTGAVFLEGIEYLVTIHGATRIGEFLSRVDAVAREHGAHVLLPVRSGLLDPADLAAITSNYRRART